jgi:hypothetical protein
MPAPEDPLWKEWLVAENALEEARDQLRTVEHLDLRSRNFRKLGGIQARPGCRDNSSDRREPIEVRKETLASICAGPDGCRLNEHARLRITSCADAGAFLRITLSELDVGLVLDL